MKRRKAKRHYRRNGKNAPLTGPEKNALRVRYGVPGKPVSKATMNSLWTKGYLIKEVGRDYYMPTSKAYGFWDHDEICRMYHNAKARQANDEKDYYGSPGHRVPYHKNPYRRASKAKAWKRKRRNPSSRSDYITKAELAELHRLQDKTRKTKREFARMRTLERAYNAYEAGQYRGPRENPASVSDDLLVHAKAVADGEIGIETISEFYRDEARRIIPALKKLESVKWAPFRQQARLLREQLSKKSPTLGSNPSEDEGENLDGMWEDDLIEFSKKHNGGRGAALIFPSQPAGYKRAVNIMARYASYKAFAMNYRKKGNIQKALTYEDECDRLYKQLPSFAKW